MVNIVHVVNQFFAGIGGEDKSSVPVGVVEGASGAARGLQACLGERATISSTIYFGDNYFHENRDQALASILNLVKSLRPDAIVAGPAFNSGRYGLACVDICNEIANKSTIPCVTAMHPENPGADAYREARNSRTFLLATTETAAGMSSALQTLARFAERLASGASIGSAEREGYLPRGIRQPETADRPGAERAIDMLLRRVKGEPITSEIPVEMWDPNTPAPPLQNVSKSSIAILSTSGVVPWGNPDAFKIFRNTHWRKYPIADLTTMEPGRWEAVHGGYNVSFMNNNPHYGAPLDVLRKLESEGVIGRIHPEYYVLPGNQGSPSVMKRIGQEIAADLKEQGIGGVLLVST